MLVPLLGRGRLPLPRRQKAGLDPQQMQHVARLTHADIRHFLATRQLSHLQTHVLGSKKHDIGDRGQRRWESRGEREQAFRGDRTSGI